MMDSELEGKEKTALSRKNAVGGLYANFSDALKIHRGEQLCYMCFLTQESRCPKVIGRGALTMGLIYLNLWY